MSNILDQAFYWFCNGFAVAFTLYVVFPEFAKDGLLWGIFSCFVWVTIVRGTYHFLEEISLFELKTMK